MFSQTDLFDTVLARYVERGADEIRIVSGYASPEMCTRLLLVAERAEKPVNIRLIVGMTGLEGIHVDTHEGLLSLHRDASNLGGSVSVHYVKRGFSVHSKLYIWLQGTSPLSAWMGSSNFTQNGFGVGTRGNKHKEIMTTTDVESAAKYFAAIRTVCISIDDPELHSEVEVHERFVPTAVSVASSEGVPVGEPEIEAYESVVLPLVVVRSGAGTPAGQVHRRSGLNWGQRPDHGREPNQAYLPVPREIAVSGFFPPKGVVFGVTTTDGDRFLMTVAQDNNKALETPQDNSIIGRYFRRRLGLADGAPIDVEGLNAFGSRFVAFYRVDDDEEEEPTYVMDYSPDQEGRGADYYGI